MKKTEIIKNTCFRSVIILLCPTLLTVVAYTVWMS